MRISTKIATSVIGLGALAISYEMGLPAADAGASTLAGSQDSTTQIDGSTGNTPTTASTPTPTPTASETTAPAPAATSKPTTTKKPTTSGSSSNSGTTAASVTKDSDSFRYRYGTIQISVTKTKGVITAVDLLQAGATGGREQAFPALQQAAIDANGSGFGNVSGATFTTDTFKQAVDNALAKF